MTLTKQWFYNQTEEYKDCAREYFPFTRYIAAHKTMWSHKDEEFQTFNRISIENKISKYTFSNSKKKIFNQNSTINQLVWNISNRPWKEWKINGKSHSNKCLLTKKSVFFLCIEILTHETLVHTDFFKKKMNFYSYSFPFAFCNNYLLSLFLFMQSAFVYTSLPKSNYGLLFTSFEVYFEMENRDNKSIVVLNWQSNRYCS